MKTAALTIITVIAIVFSLAIWLMNHGSEENEGTGEDNGIRFPCNGCGRRSCMGCPHYDEMFNQKSDFV